MNQKVARKQADEPREKEGNVIGPYQLVQLIGEGSMGRVFLARHQRLGRQVALKILRSEHVRNRSLVQRFFQEARAVNQINHEHIVQVFDFVEEQTPGGETRVYCVMEFLTGCNLWSLIKRESLPVSRIAKIMRQVCTALDAAHRVGVIHRDIKPDNIFVVPRADGSDYVKVLDFGVAKLTAPLTGETVSGTLDGTMIGTPTYMSPEQAAGLSTDTRTDIYGVGTVLYEMLAGQPPFVSESFGQLVVQIITKPPPPLPPSTPGGEKIPVPLKKLVLRCLEKEPHNRPTSMSDLSEAFEFLLKRGYLAVKRDLTPRQIWAVTGLAAVLIAAASVSALRSSNSSKPATPVSRPPPSATAVTEAVTVRISSSPPGARITRLDTRTELGLTPLSARLTRAEQPVPLRAELPGYAILERVVSLDQDTSVDLQLSGLGTSSDGQPLKLPKKPKRRMTRDGTIDPFAN